MNNCIVYNIKVPRLSIKLNCLFSFKKDSNEVLDSNIFLGVLLIILTEIQRPSIDVLIKYYYLGICCLRRPFKFLFDLLF